MGVVAAIVAIGSAIYSASEGQKQADRTKKAAKKTERQYEQAADKQERLDTISARRERLSAIRETRIKRASMEARGEALGVSGSSGVLGGVSSLESQLGSNIAFSETTAAFGQSIGQNMLNASRIQTQNTIDAAQSSANIGMAKAVGSIAGSMADYSALGGATNTNPGMGSSFTDNIVNDNSGSFASQLPSNTYRY